MAVILWICMIVVPFLLGSVCMRCFGKVERKENFWPGEYLPAGLCILILTAQVFYLATVFLKQSVMRMAVLWGGLVAVLALTIAVLGILEKKRGKSSFKATDRSGSDKSENEGVWDRVLTGILLLSVLFQIIWIMTGDAGCAAGDMTLETVRSFLATDQAYSVNPLTGQAYVTGLPLRLKVLCLPGLYAFICSLTGLDPEWVAGRVVPVTVLFCSYCVYSVLGRVLFGKDRTSRLIMLLLISLLYWCGDYLDSLDGFLLLHCGYRGISIRNGVLIPFTLTACLQKKWHVALLAIVTEACIVWTLYGLGACVAVTVLMVSLEIVRSVKRRKRREACRNS